MAKTVIRKQGVRASLPALPTREDVIVPDVRVLILPLPEFTLLPFGGFLDKLRFSADDEDYSQQRYCRWDIVGLAPGGVTSSSGVEVAIQITPQQVRWADYDYLVIFGGRSAASTQRRAKAYASFVKGAARHGLTLVSIDNACFLLAELGLLNGHTVAVHPRHAVEFEAAFPRIPISATQLYLFDGKRVSCAGGSAAIDLAVELLVKHCGRARAIKGLAYMLVDEARESQHLLKSQSEEPQVGRYAGRAIALMRKQLAASSSVDVIAAEVGISRRQLDRLFLQQFEQTAQGYWQEMRLQHLRWRLINSTSSLSALADEIGAQDASHVGKLFKRRFGVSPGAFRKDVASHTEDIRA
jgi:transcriptional regulator GlxA family with amidase domain